MSSQRPCLSPETLRRVDLLFAPAERAEVCRMLSEDCGNNLPFLEKLDAVELERFRFAALKLSEGKLVDLKRAIEVAKQDWRDLLVAAGFANDTRIHQQWLPAPRKPPMIKVETATLEDVPQLTELLDILFSMEADFSPDHAKQARGLRLLLEQPEQARIFVVRAGDKLAGMASVLFNISTAEGGIVGTLEDFVVRPEHRGQGVGLVLFQHAIQFSREQGCTRMTLLTDVTNERAIRFYEQSGFKKSSMIPMRLAL